MKDFVYYNELFIIYASLLTQNERETFKDYYQEDLSLTEISENKSVSRAAVQKMIKNVLDKLNYYESKLHIYKNNKKLEDCLSINDLKDIKKIINEILEG